jgi:hypothetical protein
MRAGGWSVSATPLLPLETVLSFLFTRSVPWIFPPPAIAYRGHFFMHVPNRRLHFLPKSQPIFLQSRISILHLATHSLFDIAAPDEEPAITELATIQRKVSHDNTERLFACIVIPPLDMFRLAMCGLARNEMPTHHSTHIGFRYCDLPTTSGLAAPANWRRLMARPHCTTCRHGMTELGHSRPSRDDSGCRHVG